MTIPRQRVVSPPRRDLSNRKLRGWRIPRIALTLTVTALVGAGLLSLWLVRIGITRNAQTETPSSLTMNKPQNPAVSACFTPAQTCIDLIVGALNRAHSQIRVQAYGFTSAPILSALVSAKQRGVDVSVILDKSDERAPSGRRTDGADFVARAGIPVLIDYRPAIAHNKVIVIDEHIVLTGSYNFTAAAEHRNAENVTLIDSEEVASNFLANWESRRAVSVRFNDDDR
jgi:phospholipase D